MNDEFVQIRQSIYFV